jgi:hypothetical protein
VSQTQLDAATIPQMRADAANRVAVLANQRGAEGGQTAGEHMQSAAFNQQLQSGIAQRQAMNAVAATQSANNIMEARNAAKRQTYKDIVGGGLDGANMFGGALKKKDKEKKYNWRSSSSYIPGVDYSNMGGGTP